MKNESRKKLISKLTFEFRNAIEQAIENGENILYNKFPKGCCGFACDLLAQYFIDNKIEPIIYENRTYFTNDYSQAHTWLIVDALVIDITADQFKDSCLPLKNDCPAYIGPKNEFYQLFNSKCGSYHLHFGIEQSWSNYNELCEWYKIILKYIQ